MKTAPRTSSVAGDLGSSPASMPWQSGARIPTHAIGASRPGGSIGVFGTFYPESGMAGTFATGLVLALAESGLLTSVVAFCQSGAVIPAGERWSNVQLRPCWKHDDPVSLLKAMLVLKSHSKALNGYLFNTYVTAFGRTSAANVVGLLMPPLLALLTGKPVVVYMHNFLETQDAVQLGYQPSRLQRWGVHLLEQILLRATRVVVPLESQRNSVSKAFRLTPRWILVPFTEPFGLIASMAGPPVQRPIPPDTPARILLLGKWGPQKDLTGVLRTLRSVRDRGGQFTLSITGAINTRFPESQNEVNRVVATMDSRWFRFLGNVPENDLLNVVQNSDLVILPYNATGGYSGAMSVSAYCGLGIIAYDLPQLRETARGLGVEPVFVTKGDEGALAEEVLLFCAGVRAFRRERRSIPRSDCDARVRDGARRLLELLLSSDD